MTTIAIDSTLMMASDSQATIGNRRVQEYVQKVFLVGDCIVGIAGRYSEALVFVNALEEILKREALQSVTDVEIPQVICDELDNVDALLITPEGNIFQYEGSRFNIPVTAPVAIGSGAEYALIAMDCGKNAQEAVEVAIKYDVFSGGDIQIAELTEEESPEYLDRNELKKLTKEQLLDKFLGEQPT